VMLFGHSLVSQSRSRMVALRHLTLSNGRSVSGVLTFQWWLVKRVLRSLDGNRTVTPG
jgi:hypothetical protein